jgi:aminoglycoside 6'-N-acetyltransferase I
MPKPKSISADPAGRPSIRPLRRRDHAQWLRLRRALWPDCSAAMHRFEMQTQSARSRNRGVLVLDCGAGRLGGFIEFSVRARVDGSLSPRVGYVEGWFVEASLRGAGWGRRLVAAAEAWTAARGLTELASDAELDNPAGIRAHHAVGFCETFRLVNFIKKVRAHRAVKSRA